MFMNSSFDYTNGKPFECVFHFENNLEVRLCMQKEDAVLKNCVVVAKYFVLTALMCVDCRSFICTTMFFGGTV